MPSSSAAVAAASAEVAARGGDDPGRADVGGEQGVERAAGLNEPVRWSSSSFSVSRRSTPSAPRSSSSAGVSRTRPAIRSRGRLDSGSPSTAQSCGRAILTKSSASSSTASSTPCSVATSRTVRFELAASLTISAAMS